MRTAAESHLASAPVMVDRVLLDVVLIHVLFVEIGLEMALTSVGDKSEG
jgi:hypothetical protein